MICKLHMSGRGNFLLPSRNGRTTYLNTQSLSTNGKGLLETKSDHHDSSPHVVGCGVPGALLKTSRSVASAPAPNLDGLKARLASLSLQRSSRTKLGRGAKASTKKHYISLKV